MTACIPRLLALSMVPCNFTQLEELGKHGSRGSEQNNSWYGLSPCGFLGRVRTAGESRPRCEMDFDSWGLSRCLARRETRGALWEKTSSSMIKSRSPPRQLLALISHADEDRRDNGVIRPFCISTRRRRCVKRMAD